MTNTNSPRRIIDFIRAWSDRTIRGQFELESQGLHLVCLRIACVVIVFFVLSFTLIDFLIIPNLAESFLRARLSATVYVASIFLFSLIFSDFAKKHNRFFFALLFLGTSVFISWMVLKTGGHRSIYYSGLGILILMQAALIPTGMAVVIINSVFIFAIYLVPIIIWDTVVSLPHLINNAAFLIMTIILTIVSNGFLYLMRFQEFYGRRNLHGVNRQLHELAMKDGLTGLWNNRFLKHQIEVAMKFSRRYDTPFSILMIDLDYFKEFNDNYGHLVGDRVLIDISNLILGQIRGIDYAIRYGGDEFTVILTNAAEDGATMIMDRIRTVVKKHPFYIGKERRQLSVSVGAFTYWPSEGNLTTSELLKRADVALYEEKAKRHSGDQSH